MQPALFALVAFFFFGTSVLSVDQNPHAPPTHDTATSVTFDLSTFVDAVAIVEHDLASEKTLSRPDLLVTFGRTSAASGQFGVASAAYAMFLNEFGTNHRYSERVALCLGDSLFPFKFDSINVVHTSSGPRIEPPWRAEYSPTGEHLQMAGTAYELAASIAQDQHTKADVLLRLGWVYRILGDWESSTLTWDRCANESVIPKFTADALWLAAENLEWTNHSADAVERLVRMAREHPQDARTSAAIDRVEYLQAEAGRTPAWLSDPVASLKMEIHSRSDARTPNEVYRSAVNWLQRTGERTALISVTRWACEQNEWMEKDRIACRYDLVDALLANGDATSKAEAVERLNEIVNLASQTASVVPAGLRCCRVLTELGRFDEADGLMRTLSGRAQGVKKWELIVLSEYIAFLLQREDEARATEVFETLTRLHPEYDLSDRFDTAKLARKDGGK